MIVSDIGTDSARFQGQFDRLMNLSGASVTKESVDKAAKEFESMVFEHLVKYMFETTEGSSLWGEGHSAGLLRSMFIEAIANSGGAKSLNLQPLIKKQMLQQSAIPSLETQNTQERTNVYL